MKITNKAGLPSAMVKAAEDSINSHPHKDKTISVTRLVGSPRILQLTRRHWDDLEQEAVDLLKPMIGTAWHAHMAKYTDKKMLSEYFLTTEIDDWIVTGQLDMFDPKTKTLTDYKTSSVFGYLLGEKAEYTAQLNCYRYLLEKNGYKVKHLELAYTFTDWQWRKNVSEDYPDAPAKTVAVELWTTDYIETYISARIDLHKQAESVDEDSLPECTADEMWEKEDTWAVKKVGRKSALRVLKSEGEATAWKFDQHDQKGLSIEQRFGERTKCERFCVLSKNGVCSQWIEYKENK